MKTKSFLSIPSRIIFDVEGNHQSLVSDNLSIPSRIIRSFLNTNCFRTYYLSIPSRIITYPYPLRKVASLENFQFHQGLSYKIWLIVYYQSEPILSIPSRIIPKALSVGCVNVTSTFNSIKDYHTARVEDMIISVFNFQFHQGLSTANVMNARSSNSVLSIPSRIISYIYSAQPLQPQTSFNSIKDYLLKTH